MITDLLIAIFLITGALFMLIASIGIIRLPDLYMRMHAATKAPTLGLLLLLTAICIYFPELSVIIKVALIIFFIFLTVPIPSHTIGRAAHAMKIPKWEETFRDDMEK